VSVGNVVLEFQETTGGAARTIDIGTPRASDSEQSWDSTPEKIIQGFWGYVGDYNDELSLLSLGTVWYQPECDPPPEPEPEPEPEPIPEPEVIVVTEVVIRNVTRNVTVEVPVEVEVEKIITHHIKDGGLSSGAIIGIAVGGTILLIIFIISTCFCLTTSSVCCAYFRRTKRAPVVKTSQSDVVVAENTQNNQTQPKDEEN